jgi:hypothetical protein
MDNQGEYILDPNNNVSHMLQAFFPDEPPDNMEYHIHTRKVVNGALELTHNPPEKITMSELRAAILDNPSYGAPGMDDIPGFILKLAGLASRSHSSTFSMLH